MRKSTILLFVMACAVLMIVVGCQIIPTAEPTPVVSVTLELLGPAGSQSFSLADLKELPAVEGWGGIKSSTGEITLPAKFKGVSLGELASKAGGLSEDVGLRIVADDGYAMTFSYDQVMNGDFIAYDPATGDEITVDEPLQAILAYEKDGEPIGERHGPLRVAVVTSRNNQVVDGHWAIKWVNQVELKELGQDWTVHLEGNLVEDMDRGTLESCLAEGCHQSTWTDDHAQRWTGVPLWLLLGYVDDEEKHGDYAYQEELAQQGYMVEVTAADGYSVSFDSQRLNRNDKIIVAAQVNENPLDEEYFPLRLVGEELSKKEMVGQIAKIQLDFSGEAAADIVEPSPAPEPVAAEDSAASGGETALVIAGAVGKEKVWTLAEFKTLGLIEMTVEHPKKSE